MKNKFLLIVSLLLMASLFLVACSPAADTTPAAEATDEPMEATEEPMEETEEPMEATEEPMDEATEEPMDEEVVTIRWYVGLGAGSDEGTFEPQNAFVDKFNATHDNIELVLEIVDNEVAYDTLATQIAAGNAPCVVGPVGIRGRDSFRGAWLDLQPLIDSTGYDLSDFDPALVQFYQDVEEGQLGIPFAIFPSFVLFNKDLFDEGGFPYPPQEYGAPYIDENGEEKEWNIETMTELAKKLTVDANGNDATMDAFDPENIQQFGWMNQWTDLRGWGTMFGAGSLVADDGSAQMPEQWVEAIQWTYDGWWNEWYIPNGPYGGADFLQGAGGPFSSGNLAMAHLHMWYVAPWALGDVGFEWDLAATPSYNGVTTSKMHADTFGILKGCPHPEEAFDVLTFMLSEEHANDLLTIYGGMPARLSLQGDYFDSYGEANFPGQEITWQVVVDSMPYADNPNHESFMPSFQETNDRYNEFTDLLANTPDADIDAEIAKLLADLQAIFDAAQ